MSHDATVSQFDDDDSFWAWAASRAPEEFEPCSKTAETVRLLQGAPDGFAR